MTTANNNNIERELDWDGTIEKDNSFILLPDGDYKFTVKMYERGRFNGSDKMPPCAQATVHIEIEAPEGTVTLKNNLFLHTKTEGILSSFFASIGQKKKGEPLRMNWNNVVGSTGMCKISSKEYNGNTYNEIKRFLPAEEQQPATGGWKPGKF